MNLRLKFFLPSFLLVVLIAVIIHFYWLPNYLKLELEGQLESEKAYVKLLGQTLVPDLLSNDLAKVHKTLDDILDNRVYWQGIKLYDEERIPLYPLVTPQVVAKDRLVRFEESITFDNTTIAHLEIWVDINSSSANRIDQIKRLEILILVLLLLSVLLVAWLQERLIRVPLQLLSDSASDIALGKYESQVSLQSRDEVGKLAATFNSMREQIRQRETELIESHTREKAVIDNVYDGIITIDKTGNIERFNKAAQKIFGYDEDEVKGKNVKILMPQPYQREHDGYIQNYLNTAEKKIIGKTREVEGLRNDGTTFPLELTVTEVYLEDRRYFIGLIRDITEHKQIAKLKDEFISTVSHELRTPLTAIRGALGLVLGKGSGEMQPKMLRLLETANRNSERLIYLVNDILDIEKITAGKLDFNLEPVNLKSLAERAMEENESYAHSHNVTLQLDFNIDSSSLLLADEQRLLQVFANLISNAVKFSPENGVVRILIKYFNDKIYIAIIDTGRGIPDEFRSRIFERFSQADSSDARDKGGSGLGLTITKAIIEQLGGQIGFNSEVGKGTEFYFELPQFDNTGSNIDRESPQPAVLICEDDPDAAYILSSLLEREGIACDIASNAKDAMDLLEQQDYRLLLLDLELPDGNGLILIRNIRKSTRNADLPIIVVSGYAHEGRKELNGEAFHVADWLQKPIDPDRLKQAVAREIQNENRPAILHVEDDAGVVEISRALLEEHTDFDYALSLEEARRKIAQNQYRLIILDISLPDGSGLDLISEVDPECPIVLFTGNETKEEVTNQVAASLTKTQASNDELVRVVKQLLIREKKA